MTSTIPIVAEPIFLVGAERSGTTLLRLMLDHHPQIAWCYEFEYAVTQIQDNDNWPNLEQYHVWLETNRIFKDTGFTIDRSLDYPQLLNSFLCQKRDLAGKPVVGATVHHNFDRLLRIWPNARFIHLLRDGRDVARSCIGMGWAGNVWTGVERWIEAECLWTKLSQNLPPEKYLEVTYESLLLEPTNILKCICEFVGVHYDEAMFSYAQNTTFDRPDPSLIEQWRRKLSQREIQLVESRIANMLVDRGYQLSGLPTLKVTPIMAKRLSLQDWWARVQFRIHRYGIPLFVADYLSRKIKYSPWQKQVKLKLYAIDKSYLK